MNNRPFGRRKRIGRLDFDAFLHSLAVSLLPLLRKSYAQCVFHVTE